MANFDETGRTFRPVSCSQPDNTSLNRRKVINISAASAVSLFSAACAATQQSVSRHPGLPDVSTLRDWTRRMTRFGQRYIGSAAHNNYVDYLARQFTNLGLPVKHDTENFENWTARRWAFSIESGAHHRSLHVAAYYTFSGVTGADGVVGELVWLDGPDAGGRNVEGKIVAFRRTTERSIVERNLAFPATDAQAHSPGHYEQVALKIIRPSALGISADRLFVTHLILSPRPAQLKAAGAAGVIIVEDDVPALTLNGCYVPFIYPYQDLPALFVNAHTGRQLEQASGAQVRLTLHATRGPASTDHISAVIPGQSDEIIVLASHTDGPNAFEENGSIGVVALAHHLTSIPLAERPRTIVLACATGHMSPLPSKDLGGWFAANPEIQRRTVAVVAVEHLGATEWIAQGDYARRTGAPEQGLCFISNHDNLRAATMAVFERANLANVALLGPVHGDSSLHTAPSIPGIGDYPNHIGIPTVGYITGPPYLLSWDENDHFDKFDPQRMHDELVVLADLLHALGGISAADLQASTVEQS